MKTVKRETQFVSSTKLTLADLRDIVEQTSDYDAGCYVVISTSYGQRDQHEATTVTVHGA